MQPLPSVLFGSGAGDDGLLKAYRRCPWGDASELLHRIAHDQRLTAAERADSMLGLVSMPGTVLFNADDTKAWQVLLGGITRPILPPPHHPHTEHDEPGTDPRPARPPQGGSLRPAATAISSAHRKDAMHDDPSDDFKFSTGDRVELVFTSDPHTRLRPGDRGTVTGITRIPSEPPEPQVHVAWDSGSTLSMLPDAGDQLRKLTNDPDPADPP